MTIQWHPRTLQCMCHQSDVCPDYENQISEQESEIWWATLTEEEKKSYSMKLCNNCYHAFEPTDDDGEHDTCTDCADWLDVYEQEGINF